MSARMLLTPDERACHKAADVFVSNADETYTCGPCAEATEGQDLGDDCVEVWEQGSNGWCSQPSPCRVCGDAIEVVIDRNPDGSDIAEPEEAPPVTT